jgi:hypothetical protein
MWMRLGHRRRDSICCASVQSIQPIRTSYCDIVIAIVYSSVPRLWIQIFVALLLYFPSTATHELFTTRTMTIGKHEHSDKRLIFVSTARWPKLRNLMCYQPSKSIGWVRWAQAWATISNKWGFQLTLKPGRKNLDISEFENKEEHVVELVL